MASPSSPRLSGLLLYPVQSGLLGMLAICALLRLLSFYLESPIWVQWLPDLQVGGDSGRVFTVVFGLLIDLGVCMLGFKFAIEAMLDTAHDRATTAGHGWHVATDRQAIGQILLALVLFLPAYLLMLFDHPGLGWTWFAFAFAAWPAAAMIDAMDDNFVHALNPLAWGALLARLGADYFVALVGIALLLTLVVGLHWAVLSHLPPILAAALARFVQLFALVLAFRGLGQMLLQRHESLGLDTSPPIVRPMLGNAEEDELMQRTQWLLDQGQPAQAIDGLQDLIRRRGASAPIHLLYRQLSREARDWPRLAEHARGYVGNLLALGQDRQALALVAESLRDDPDFRLDDAEAIARLTLAAASIGHSQLGETLSGWVPAR